ncbi:MAG: hypothetical protein LBB53_03000 [Prevotellaceae bacterium]|jgi:hypothetical protein|nr:hypothetical protein [Prevotellaceae bacterium]
MQLNRRNILTYTQKYGKSTKKTEKQQVQSVLRSTGVQNRSDLLYSAHAAWQSMSSWRDEARRNEEFIYGDQWLDATSEYFRDSFGVLREKAAKKTERKALQEQGLNPPQYNILRNIVRTIVGNWLANKTLPVCIAQKDNNQEESEILTATLHAVLRKNEWHKLMFSQLTQTIITAIAGLDITWSDLENDVKLEQINIFNFFIDNKTTDIRFRNCSLAGYFIDLTLDDLICAYANENKERENRLRTLYSSDSQEHIIQNWVETFTGRRFEKDFFISDTENSGMCRVFIVQTKEKVSGFEVRDRLTGKMPYLDIWTSEKEFEAENERRRAEQGAMGVLEENMLLLEYTRKSEMLTKFYHLTPNGEVLLETFNPYWHKNFSIQFEIYEFFIGKIYPFIKDVIDAQKQINQVIAMSQLLTRYGAKDIWFLHERIVNEYEGGEAELENRISKYGAVIKTKGNVGEVPPPVNVNTVSQAFTPLNVVQMYLNLSEKVSGVFGALQGQSAHAGTPAQMYAMQTQNSAITLNGLYEAISGFTVRCAKIIVQLIQQYYTEERYIFNQDKSKFIKYDPSRVKNIDFEISIAENTNTPAYRLMQNDILMQLKQFDTTNRLDLKGLVQVGNFPFKEELLQYLSEQEQAAAQMQQQQPIPPELAAQMAQYQLNPELQAQMQAIQQNQNNQPQPTQ